MYNEHFYHGIEYEFLSNYFCNMQQNGKFDWIYVLLFAFGFCVFVFGIGATHLFDWDEANFAEAAREMVLSGDWMRVQINYEPFWEKPPLFIWMQALSMSVFGFTEFAARFPNALIGAVTLCVLYAMGKRVGHKKFALIWALVYSASWLPHFYFKTAIIDPLFNLLIFISINFFWRALDHRKLGAYILSGLFLGLAVLTKGPAALLICGISIALFMAMYQGFQRISWSGFVWFCLATLLSISVWFGIDILKNGLWFTETFIAYQIRLFSTQDAGHGGPFYYHFLVLLLGCFPASVFFFQYTFSKKKRLEEYADFDLNYGRWMQLLFWVTLIIFSIVKTKIVHYSSLCYLPLSFLAAREIWLWSKGAKKLRLITRSMFWAIGLILSLAIFALPILGVHKESWTHWIADPFTAANLQADVHWAYWEVVFGLLVLLCFIVFIFWKRKNRLTALYVFFISQAISITAIVYHFTPKIEAYSQGAAISFYQSVETEEDAVIFPVGMKSYAYLFYSQKKLPDSNEKHSSSPMQVMEERLDLTLYLVVRNFNEDQIQRDFPKAKKMDERNGYLLYKVEQATEL